MMPNRFVKRYATFCVLLGLLFHPLVLRLLHAELHVPEQPNASGMLITVDLSIEQEGTLQGRLVSPRGNAISGKNLTLIRDQKTVFAVTTNQHGRFAIPTPLPGIYAITDGTWVQPIRVWAKGTGPPVAKKEVLIVSREPIVAGQVSPLRYWMANPNVMLATAAIAIAVPVLIYRPATQGPPSP